MENLKNQARNTKKTGQNAIKMTFPIRVDYLSTMIKEVIKRTEVMILKYTESLSVNYPDLLPFSLQEIYDNCYQVLNNNDSDNPDILKILVELKLKDIHQITESISSIFDPISIIEDFEGGNASLNNMIDAFEDYLSN